MNSDAMISIVFLLIFATLMFYLAYRGFKKQSAVKNAKMNISQRLGATMNATLKHTEGLPLAPGVLVDVYYGPERIAFVKDKQEISISTNKITSIDCVTGQNIKSQQMAGAATGKYVFGGMTGAVIGSLVATTTYLVISYTSEGKDKYVMLDTYVSGMFARKVQKDFAKTSTATAKSIEL